MASPHRKSILHTLFIPYTILFTLPFMIIIATYIFNEHKNIRESSLLSVENNLMSISQNVDSSVETLDTISQNVIYSNLIKERFASYISYTSPAGLRNASEEYSSLQNNKILSDLLVAMIGPNYPVEQIYLYGLEHSTFGTGLDNAQTASSVREKDWYTSTMEAHGDKYLFQDSDERLAKYYSYEEGQHFLTLCRVYYNSFNTPQGIVEVKKSMSSLTQLIYSFYSAYDEAFYVFDAKGGLIYPFYTTADSPDYYDLLCDEAIPSSPRKNCLIKETDTDFLLYDTSSYSGFTTLAVVKKSRLLSSMYKNIVTSLVLLFLTCGLIIVVSYYISRRIGTPLKQMYSQIHSFHISADSLPDIKLKEVDTNITELHTLYDALIKMQTYAQLSMQKALQLQNKEMQARMLALQAQMNPHFLYNSLATIQAMADEGMTDKIELMCQNMSSILRYISSDSEQLVALKYEISHTVNYLECMKIRYDNELHYKVDIPEVLNDFQIPKLCLQLLVENAVKFTTGKKGPWYISIDGILTETYWEIHIADNGPGFDDTELKNLQRKFEEIDRTGVLPNLEINGMGLMNIYIRFKLLFEGNYIFHLNNRTPNGAIITIGGYL